MFSKSTVRVPKGGRCFPETRQATVPSTVAHHVCGNTLPASVAGEAMVHTHFRTILKALNFMDVCFRFRASFCGLVVCESAIACPVSGAPHLIPLPAASKQDGGLS